MEVKNLLVQKYRWSLL